MKLTLTPEATLALKEIVKRIQKINPYAIKSATAATASILLDFGAHADAASFERVVDRLISPKAKRKALFKKLADLAEVDGEAALQVLEKSVRKLNNSAHAVIKKSAENSQI